MNNKKIGLIIVAFAIIIVILLGFVKANVDVQEAFLCEQVHKVPDLDIKSCPAMESNNSWLLLIAFGIAFLSLGLGIYLIFSNAKEEVKEIETKESLPEIDLSKLNEEEKKLYELIKEKGGSAYQSDLIKETGFSKVKITRVLDKMEQKKIIDRHRRGMANLIVIK